MKPLRLVALTASLLLSGGLTAHSQTSADVIVYGSTGAGCCAAIAAAREGASVILLEPTDHVGGMNTGGLSFSDSFGSLRKTTLGGLWREWHQRIYDDYTERGITLPYSLDDRDGIWWTWEPHVAMRVTQEMLDEAGVTVLTDRYLQSVTKTGSRITALVTDNGTYTGRVFIDGSYEGDLMAAAGVSWTIGREGREEFNEPHAGVQYSKAVMPINGFDEAGEPLPLVTTTQQLPEGAGDDSLQVFSFRLVLTRDPENRVPMPKPANYDPARWELLRRYAQSGGTNFGFDLYPLPGGKFDGNDSIGMQFSLGFVGGAQEWCDADEAGRAAISEAHRQYTLELFHFLTTDPSVPSTVRNRYVDLGLCKDEFASTGNFPPALYVRQGRRMTGGYFMTENDISNSPRKDDPVAISSFPIDSHDVTRVALEGGGVYTEGKVLVWESGGTTNGKPFHVPYSSIVPKVNECDNLIVPVALSCTHVVICSIRVEPTWMVIGQSAGIAAAMTANRDIAVQDLPYADLRPRLEAQGQLLTLPGELEGIVLDDPEAELAGTWTQSTNLTPYVGDGYRFAGAAGTPNDGSAVATFRFTAPQAGTYQLNMAYTPNSSRATNVPVTVTSGPNVTNFSVDQTVARPAGSVVREIGNVVLVSGEESVITVGTAGTTGFVILDAIQLVLDNSGASLDWSTPGSSAVTEDSALISANLIGDEAEVTLYWKEGTSAPEQQTGWDGSISNPGVNVSPGLVERTINGLQADTLFSCIYYANNSTIPTEAWSPPLTFATALTSAQNPVITGAVANGGTITLSWQDNAMTETGYSVQRATAPGGPYATIANLAADSTSYVDGSVAGGQTYYYQVSATNSENGSSTDFSAAQTSATADTAPILTNGDFETGDFTGWTVSGTGSVVSTTSPLAGTYSAVQTPSSPAQFVQSFTPITGPVTTTFIFSASDPGGANDRSFNPNLRGSDFEGGGCLINLRVVDLDADGDGDIQAFSGTPGSGGTWTTVLPDAVTFGTPTIFSLTINGFGGSFSYDLDVGGNIATGLTALQTTATSSTLSDFAELSFVNSSLASGSSVKIDNVTVTVPGSDTPFVLTITANASNPGNYDFTWRGSDGKSYDLVSSTDLSTSPSGWPVWDDRSGIAGTTPINALTNVPGGGDPRRFFAIVENE